MNIPFKKILIANRGEIAVRVMRTCRRLGIRTVAVYSDADREALHVQRADESFHIGESAPAQSYLVIDKIIDIATRSGAGAIHPGYGFLSENPEFAEACQAASVCFIGPSAESMRLMGDKLSARKVAAGAGAPIVPGIEAAAVDVREFQTAAESLGYPALIKASAGGGGKGMRLVRSAAELPDAIEAAAREAGKSFGDSTIYLERYLDCPRHIEFQVFGDKHGNVAHLFERECSIQRRHQKIIEETPSTALSPELRQQMGEAAVNIARAAGYCNAGTVEFLLDQSGKFYFLEMNTRLQVEHPITEMVTGLDLVAEQIRVAGGIKLSDELLSAKQGGHAIECRIYAEDAANEFFPSSGRLLRYEEPTGDSIRVDSGVCAGAYVGIDYDPILAKLIAGGQNREEAIGRMLEALREYVILGIKTCTGYLRDILMTQEFKHGDIHTGFIESVMPETGEPDEDTRNMALAVAALALETGAHLRVGAALDDDDDMIPTPWVSLTGWRLGGAL